MPELPEVETIARTLEPQIQGSTIINSQLLLPRTLDAGSLNLEALHGKKITSVSRRAKLALINLSTTNKKTDPHLLAVHLKMTGRLFVYPQNTEPMKHTRLIIDLDHDGHEKRLFFDDCRTFGYVRLVSPATLPLWPFWNKLGLEPLQHSPEELAACLYGKKGGIKSLLLNQEYIVGIGNIYADEALFQAKIAPDCKTFTISMAKLIELCTAIQAILRLSIEQCGSSIRDYRTANGDAGSFQNTFFVYGRGGEECRTCGHTLSSAKIAGRTTVFCSKCQSNSY